MVKTGAGTLTLAAPVELEKCATTVDAGCLTFADRAEVATLSGSGDVAVLAGRVSVHTLGGSLHLLARLNRSGEENLADNGLIHLAASETALPAALTLYLGADDDPAARYYGALCVPLDLPLAARLDTIPTTVYVQDATGTHHFDGETWRAVTATVSARPVTFSIDGLPLQGRMLSVTRGPEPEQPFSYAQWCRSVFPPEAFDDAATVAPATERDGIPNLFRYAFGMSLEDTAADFYPHLDLIGEGRRYRWKMIPSRDDLRYRIEAVSDVRDWSDPECLFDSDQQLPGPPDPLGWRFLIDEQTLPKRFYRLRVFLKEQPSE